MNFDPRRGVGLTAGMGLRHPHLVEFEDTRPSVSWVEVHTENFWTDSKHTRILEKIASNYPLSLHGVGLSLGSADPLNYQHLSHTKELVERFNPILCSEHMSWSAIDGEHFNDLLPLPYTKESFENFCQKVSATQDFLGLQIAIENPSSYLTFATSTMNEWEFYAELPNRTGCTLLLDIGNLYVSCQNFGYDPQIYLAALKGEHIQEIHLAGHTINKYPEGVVYIDDHGSAPPQPVWDIYTQVINLFGTKPTLIEWDNNLPTLEVLLTEVRKIENVLNA